MHFFNISTSKSVPTLRCFVPFHFNGVQLFISHLPRCLRTRRFSEPTFQPSGATKPRKNTEFRDFPTFSRTCIFFLLIFSLLTLLPADCFFISILSEVWLLNFLRLDDISGLVWTWDVSRIMALFEKLFKWWWTSGWKEVAYFYQCFSTVDWLSDAYLEWFS